MPATTVEVTEYLTVEECLEWLKMSRNTFKKFCTAHGIAHYTYAGKSHRYRRHEIEAAIDATRSISGGLDNKQAQIDQKANAILGD